MTDKNLNVRLAGTVILFQPSPDIIINIESYLFEIDILYVIDNSPIKNEKLLNDIEKLSPKCKLVINHENYGIAEALNQAVELASNNGYEWLLTMDQDSHFENSEYFVKFNEYKNKHSIALFTPELIVFSEDLLPGKEIKYKPIYDMMMSSGSILNLEICIHLAGFETKLFIDEVDTDFCFKLLKNEYSILQIEGACLIHPQGLAKYINLPFKNKLRIIEHQPFRHYYITRNNFYIFKKYIKQLPKITLRRWKVGFIIKTILGILFHRQRCAVIKFTYLGFYDFIRNRYGSLEDRGQQKSNIE